jgi:cytochrome P450
MFVRTDLPPVPIRGAKPPPLLGAMGGVLRFFADPVAAMLQLHRDHGDVAAAVDGNAAIVCAFGAAHNKTVNTQLAAFEHLSEVPIPVPKGSAFERLNNTILFMNGDTHKKRRRLLMPAFSKAAVDGYAPRMMEVADEMIGRWPVGTVTDVAPLLRDVTATIALRCLLGLDMGRETEELARMETDLLATIASPFAMLFPFAVPGTPLYRAVRLSERVEARLREEILRKRAAPGGTDALSRLIAARDEDGSELSEADLCGECNSLFAAGYDTSAHTLTWTMLLLALHPDVLDDVADEIRDVTGGGPPGAEHLPRLGKLDRVVKESMRLMPVAVLLFMRVCAEEVKLGPHTLPKGSTLFLSPLITHRDEALYPNPRRFDPSRWVDLEPSAYEYLPFGAGARMCIGAAFATVALRLTLARILQKVRPVVPAGTRVDYSVNGPAMGTKRGLRLELRPAGAKSPSPPPIRGNVHALVELPA